MAKPTTPPASRDPWLGDLSARPVERDLSLLLQAARVSPILRDAVQRVDDEVARLRAGVQRIRALHLREVLLDGRAVCGWCREASEDPWPWPCPTVAALGGGRGTESRAELARRDDVGTDALARALTVIGEDRAAEHAREVRKGLALQGWTIAPLRGARR